MNFTAFSCILLLAVATASGTESLGGTVYSDCGGNLNASLGVISYKNAEPFMPNERCVWVIRVPEAKGYHVGLVTSGFPISSEDHQVIATGIKFRGSHSHIPLKTTDVQIFENSTVLVVTFHSGSENTLRHTGFIVQYTAVFTGTVFPVAPQSVDRQFNSGRGIVKHPANEYLYSNYEISTFVFAPNGNIYNPNDQLEVAYVKGQLEEGNDFLHVLTFNQNNSGIEKWSSPTSITNSTSSTFFVHSDLILAIFGTDSSDIYQGFTWVYSI